MSRIPLVAILLLIAAAQAAPAKESKSDGKATPSAPPPKEEEDSSSLSPIESGTFTMDIDTDLILTTDSRGEIFSQGTDSPFGTTEEPLPDSVVLQLELERAQTAQPELHVSQTTEINGTTEKPRSTETTIQINGTTLRTRSNATTEPPKGKYTSSFFQGKLPAIGTANLVDESVALHSEEDSFESRGATMPPLLQLIAAEGQLVATPRILPELEESRTEAGLFWLANTEAVAIEQTTLVPEQEDKESTTGATTQETTELSSTPHSTFTKPPVETTTGTIETTTGTIETTTIDPITTTETIETTSNPPTTTTETIKTTTSAPTTTTETIESTTGTIETTTEIIETTTNAPRTTTSPAPVLLTTRQAVVLGSQPETTAKNVEETTTSLPITTQRQTSPDTTTTIRTTIPTTNSPSTNAVASTPEPRAIQTRAPRVERIFNSDGVEVLYGYSSVVRTNRS
ncbi:mucin-5AC isoform X2 [Drosophila miranda]|uniref:mucin-5AC isoform X2 n=1 Tax=Drosophila miranda TaxID=7229 RepID=UPI00143F8156|nr:mucin-5AC isoform X2 [Drosophila miranda]